MKSKLFIKAVRPDIYKFVVLKLPCDSAVGANYNFYQKQQACKEIGIEIIFASFPQGKGRIERVFDTLQVRLTP